MPFYIGLQNSVVIGRSSAELLRHMTFLYGGHTLENVLPGSGLVTASVGGRNISA